MLSEQRASRIGIDMAKVLAQFHYAISLYD